MCINPNRLASTTSLFGSGVPLSCKGSTGYRNPLVQWWTASGWENWSNDWPSCDSPKPLGYICLSKCSIANVQQWKFYMFTMVKTIGFVQKSMHEFSPDVKYFVDQTSSNCIVKFSMTNVCIYIKHVAYPAHPWISEAFIWLVILVGFAGNLQAFGEDHWLWWTSGLV